MEPAGSAGQRYKVTPMGSLADLMTENEKLREAIRPFVTRLLIGPGGAVIAVGITEKDVRRARAALNGE